MRVLSGKGGSIVAAIGAFALGVAGYNLVGGGGGGDAEPEERPATAEVQAVPSEFAHEALPAQLLRIYQGVGEDLGLDWSVIAAIDQLEGGAGPAEDEERVAAIGYSLAAHGAPESYRLAAEAHGGSVRYAREALRLADRYREVADADPPVAEGPLRKPAEGQIIAAFGRQLGVLHDGIDIAAPTGEPVRAAADGLVVSTGTHTIFGQYTCVLHRFAPPLRGEERLTTCYGNQSRFATEPGARVERGDVIGYVGCTGTCMRPGVHFQVRLGSGPSAPVADPDRFLAEPVRAPAGRPIETPAQGAAP